MTYSGSVHARKVPLNYSEPAGQTIAVALIQLRSAFPFESEGYKGPILFNPGGPGGSGVDIILRLGSHFHQLFNQRFDIVGFDPRGEFGCVRGVSS